jgi:hypothetical protein
MNDDAPYCLESIGEFYINGRGKVFTVASPVECKNSEILRVIGPKVIIDGVEYETRAVEFRGMVTRKGHPIGILVRGLKDGKDSSQGS